MGPDTERELDTGGGGPLTPSSSMCRPPPQARVMMGPEEVLIRGENVSVNGRLVPEGASQLLPGKAAVGTRRWPRARFTSLGQSVHPQGAGQRAAEAGQLGGPPQPPDTPHGCWESAFGDEGAR